MKQEVDIQVVQTQQADNTADNDPVGDPFDPSTQTMFHTEASGMSTTMQKH